MARHEGILHNKPCQGLDLSSFTIKCDDCIRVYSSFEGSMGVKDRKKHSIATLTT